MLGNVIISRKNIHIDRNLWRLQFASQVSLIDKFGDLLKLWDQDQQIDPRRPGECN